MFICKSKLCEYIPNIKIVCDFKVMIVPIMIYSFDFDHNF